MYGTPYWGKETFQEVRDIKELPTNDLTIDKITDLCKSKGLVVNIEDTYSLFFALSKLDLLFITENKNTYVTWCRDIRFNYRDRNIYIPYFEYETEQRTFKRTLLENAFLDMPNPKTLNIRHNFKLSSTKVNDRKDSTNIDSLLLYDHINKIKYHLPYPSLPYLIQPDFSLADLAERYLNSAYIESEVVEDTDWKKYLKVGTKGKKSKEHKIRLKAGLKLYANQYTDMTYTDVRKYTFEELNNGSHLRLDDTKPFWERVFEFEAYLYCIFAQGIKVQEQEYQSDFVLLGVSKRHLTYDKSTKPLILKHYYTDKTMQTRRKSFERYKG
jgi:hypothetical protein